LLLARRQTLHPRCAARARLQQPCGRTLGAFSRLLRRAIQAAQFIVGLLQLPEALLLLLRAAAAAAAATVEIVSHGRHALFCY
jgi:hypothetical protein